MSFSEIPPPPEVSPGQDEPYIRVRPPGPQARTWLTRAARTTAPMGRVAKPPAGVVKADVPSHTIVCATAKGSNLTDVDGNRFVDLAAGFGAISVGHAHPNILRVIELQSGRLLQALGDVHPSDAKIALLERLSALYPAAGARVILGQSGADAVSAALKTAALATGRPGVIAFEGAYHGLGYGPLAACGLRASYREPFSGQLNPHVLFLPYPHDPATLEQALERARFALGSGEIGALLIEPILGRGGVVVPPPELLPELARMARRAGALLIADEIWTGLGRAGKLLYSVGDEPVPDLICLGKGLGGGLPISACIGSEEVMRSWRREREVVHTSTFAGAPLACATALATLDLISRGHLCERSAEVGARWLGKLESATAARDGVAAVRGTGLMVGIDLGARPDAACALSAALLERGYIASTGGGAREVLVLTPPLTISEPLLDGFVAALSSSLQALARA
jgi:4-aminobutyrate aminotransferase / (S)-3-amino-2-methylpropionate transaminase / 5-aminovalerate transaminase